MNTVLFYIIIFLTNVIQGITGFAGTILAMPPSLILVGFTAYMGKGSVIQKKNHHGNQCCYLLVRE